MTNKTSGIVRGSVGFVSRGAIQILLFLVTIVATRFLTISEFGGYALATSFIFLSRALFYVGPYEYLLKSKEAGGLKRSCFHANMTLAVCATIGLLVFAWVGPILFKTTDVGTIIIWLIPSIYLAASTAWYEALLLRTMMVQRYYAYTVAGECVGSVLAIVLLATGHGVMSLVIQVYARLATLLLLYVVATGERPPLRINWVETKEVIRWSWSRYAAVFLNFVSSYGADFILGVFLSPAATGIYRASNRIVSALTDLFAQPLQKIAQTNLSARVARGDDVGDSWLGMLAGVGAIGWATITGLAFVARDVIPVVLGEKWAAAAPVVTVFCVVKAFTLVDAVTTSLLICHDRQRTMLWVQISVACLVVALSWLVSGYGPVAVAAAVGVVLIGMSVTYASMAVRISGVSRTVLRHTATTALIPALCVGGVLALFQTFHISTIRHEIEILLIVPLVGLGFILGAYPLRHRIIESIGQLGHAGPAT
jgi:O-antigen/teichoic acid export membrane protein